MVALPDPTMNQDRQQPSRIPRAPIGRCVRQWNDWFLTVLLLVVTFEQSASAAGAGEATNASPTPATVLHPIYGVGQWIWMEQTQDQQTCRFFRPFEIPR